MPLVLSIESNILTDQLEIHFVLANQDVSMFTSFRNLNVYMYTSHFWTCHLFCLVSTMNLVDNII